MRDYQPDLTKTKTEPVCISLRIPPRLCQLVDQLAYQLEMSRSQTILGLLRAGLPMAGIPVPRERGTE